MAAVFAGVFIVGQRGDIRELLATAASQPKRALVCGTISSWRGAQVADVPKAAPITIIANFPKRGEAERSFQGLTNRLPASATLKTFGDSVLLTLPAGEAGMRKQWFAELQRQTKMVFVDSSNAPAILLVSCQLATKREAKELEDELTLLSAWANCRV